MTDSTDPQTAAEFWPYAARHWWSRNRNGDCPAWSVPDEADIAEMVQAAGDAPVSDGDERHAALAARLAKVGRYANELLGATADVQVRDGRMQVRDVTADPAVCHDAELVHAMWLATDPAAALSHPFAPLVAAWCAHYASTAAEPDLGRGHIMPRGAAHGRPNSVSHRARSKPSPMLAPRDAWSVPDPDDATVGHTATLPVAVPLFSAEVLDDLDGIVTLPVPLWRLGVGEQRRRPTPLVQRVLLEAITRLPIEQRGLGPVAVAIPWRELLSGLRPGTDWARSSYAELLAFHSDIWDAADLLGSRAARVPIGTGDDIRWRSVVTVRDLPGNPRQLDDGVATFMVDVPGGDGAAGPLYGDAHRKLSVNSAVAHRLAVAMDLWGWRPGVSHAPTGHGGKWRALRWNPEPLTMRQLASMAYPGNLGKRGTVKIKDQYRSTRAAMERVAATGWRFTQLGGRRWQPIRGESPGVEALESHTD